MNNGFDENPQDNQFSFPQNGFEMPQPKGHANGFATASMWLGIASVVCTCCCCFLYWLSPITSILAIVMACLAKRDNGGKMPGKAIAGMILGILGIVFFLCYVAFLVGFFSIPDSQLKEIIYQAFEDSGVSFEEYVDSLQSAGLLE